VVLASPVYWQGVSAQMKCFLDRLSSYFNRPSHADRFAGKGYVVVTTFGRKEAEHGQWVTEPLKVSVAVLRGRYLGDVAVSVYQKGKVREMPAELRRARDLGAMAVRQMAMPETKAESASGDSVRIAPMVAEDYDEVLALWRSAEGEGVDANEESDSREAIAKYLARNPGMSAVARDGDRLVGAILCGHDGRRGYLNHLVIASSHRRRGIGTALVAHCLAALKGEGIPRCNLFTYSANIRARRFWEALGWITPPDWGVMHRRGVDMNHKA
jgi:ribosomal protein S18 acetylase RimI-like enzyme